MPSTYGADFRHFDKSKILPNTVYTCHDYSAYGFPNPPELFTGTREQIEYHEKNFDRKASFMREIGVSRPGFGPSLTTGSSLGGLIRTGLCVRRGWLVELARDQRLALLRCRESDPDIRQRSRIVVDLAVQR